MGVINKREVAVLDFSCIGPGIKTPADVWKTVIERKKEFRIMPDVRLPEELYYSKNGNLPDPSTTSSIESYNGFSLMYPGDSEKPMLRPKIIDSHSFLRKGMVYNSDSVSSTYSSLSRLLFCQQI